jgi:uncharacterized protein (DUF1015 family)
MAEVLPFRGIFYNPGRIENLSDVVAPPFDVISPEEQEAFHRRHPKNVIRLILGQATENDTETDNPHTRAAAYFRQWREEETLVQDPRPALYMTAVTFPLHGRPVTRYGFIAKIRLEPFEKRIVLPHEKTFSKVRSERLELMKRCHANFSPIFSLYPGGNGVMQRLRREVEKRGPDLELTDHKGIGHRLWRIQDPSLHRDVTEALAEKRLFIADGHHRYETALRYRDWLARRTPGFNEDHPANFVMMYLCSMDDPGLVILPAHRMLDAVEAAAAQKLLERAVEYFEVESFSPGTGAPEAARDTFLARLRSEKDTTAIGVVCRNVAAYTLWRLKPGVMETLFGKKISPALLPIDVTVLTRLVFMELLGFDNARLDDERLIHYDSVAESAIQSVTGGRHDIVFLLNPTKIEQVRTVCEQGLIMPRKATYFYPKVLSGRVFHTLEA